MIRTPLTLIIGAGASAEFGMPTGVALKKGVASDLDFTRKNPHELRGDNALHELLSAHYGEHFRAIVESAIALAKQAMQRGSIDDALNWFSSNKEIVEIGKATIVRRILAAEREAAPEEIQNWVEAIFSLAIESGRPESISQLFSQLRIINFNYDRVVEHFLLSALRRILSDEQAREALAGLEIVRPHGSIGPLDWQDPSNGVSFGYDLRKDHARLFTLAQQIRTYSEQDAAGKIKSQITNAIEQSRVVIILGFGFHQANIKLLEVPRHSVSRVGYSTAHGIDEKNFAELSNRMSYAVGCPQRPLEMHSWTASQLMQKLMPSIRSIVA